MIGLRNNWYFENLFFSLPSALASGNWYSAAGEGRIAHIARDDLALAPTTALAGESSGKTTGGLADINGDFEKLTGRKPQSFEDWLAANKQAWKLSS